MAKNDTGQGNDPELEKDALLIVLMEELKESRGEVQAMRLQVNGLLRDQGLECAIQDAAGRLETIFAPLQSLVPVRDFETAKGAVTALRRSLKRANFDAPPTDFGSVFDGNGNVVDNPKGSSAS